jgi:perosamine synthetase
MFNSLRNSNSEYFNDELEDIEGISIPCIDDRIYHVYNQYTIIVHDECKLTRDDLSKELNKRNIGTGIYYPNLINEQLIIDNKKCISMDLSNAEYLKNRVLSLPVHPLLSKEDLSYIVDSIKDILK